MEDPLIEEPKLQEVWDWHCTVILEGPVLEMDEHQKWIEDTASLAGRHVIVKVGASNNGAVSLGYMAHFEASRAIDAVLMATGLFNPPDGKGIAVIELQVARFHHVR